jgi:hypothetical protein
MQVANIEILMDSRSRQRLQRTGMVLAVVGLMGMLLPQVIPSHCPYLSPSC